MLDPNHRILIVDDDPAIHEDFRKILCPALPDRSQVHDLRAAIFNKASKAPLRQRFELVSAFQGEEAVALVNQSIAGNRPFAMAFLDVRMPPGWDGVERHTRSCVPSPRASPATPIRWSE